MSVWCALKYKRRRECVYVPWPNAAITMQAASANFIAVREELVLPRVTRTHLIQDVYSNREVLVILFRLRTGGT